MEKGKKEAEMTLRSLYLISFHSFIPNKKVSRRKAETLEIKSKVVWREKQIFHGVRSNRLRSTLFIADRWAERSGKKVAMFISSKGESFFRHPSL